MKFTPRLPRIAIGALAVLGSLAVGIGAFVITTNIVGPKRPTGPL